MVGWDHQPDGDEFEQALGVGDEQGSLLCCSSWGCEESDMTELLNRTELLGLPSWRQFQNTSANAGDERDAGLNPGSERSPGEGNGNPLQYSCLEHLMDRG